MKLYELSEAFRNLFDSLEDAQNDPDRTPEEIAEYEDAWFTGLVNIEETFDKKAESIGAWIKELEADAEEMRKAERDISQRRRAKESLVKRLKDYLLREMIATDRKKIDQPLVRISVRNNAETAQFEDEKSFIEWAKENADDLLKYAEPEIARTKVKEFLQAGHEIEGVTLGRSQSVIIK
ncbi:MAG: siphovirus Gp157 family protein [Ruminococcus sp.]|nr:siphovirus Gp157 family protein [Ruminococcus sp.]